MRFSSFEYGMRRRCSARPTPVPVPVPMPDAKPIPSANPSSAATDLPISLKPKAPPVSYKYKAYGEK